MISLKIALSGFVAFAACMICALIAGDDLPEYVKTLIVIGVALSLLASFGGAIAVIWTMLPMTLSPIQQCYTEAATLAELAELLPPDCNQLHAVRKNGVWECYYIASIVPVDEDAPAA